MKTTVKILLLLASIMFSYANADVAVIVHKDFSEPVTADDISRIYLGKSKTLSSGFKVIPINLDKGASARDEFNDKALNKSENQLKSYWARIVFTGKGQPPKDVGDASEVIKLIADNPNMIGYIESDKVTENVKVVVSY